MRIYLTEDIFIEQCAYAPFNWDLYTVSKGRRRDKIEEVEKAVAYGVDLEFIAQKAVFYKLKLSGEEKVSLDQFIDRFKKIQKEISENLKESIKNFKKLEKNGIRQKQVQED